MTGTVFILTMVTLAGNVVIDNIPSERECVAMAEILINATQFTKGYTVNCDRLTEDGGSGPGIVLMPREPAPAAAPIIVQQVGPPSPQQALYDALQELAKKLRDKGTLP